MKRGATSALKTTAMNVPALAAGVIVGGVVGRVIYEQPPRVQEIDNTQYEVRGEDQKRLAEMEADKINTEPPNKKVRFEEQIDFSKPSEEERRPSRLAPRTREPGQYDFSTSSRGASRQS